MVDRVKISPRSAGRRGLPREPEPEVDLGRDVERDLHATLISDGAWTALPAVGDGEDARVHALLNGVCSALETAKRLRRPTVIRMPVASPPMAEPDLMDPYERAVALVTALWDPPHYRATRRRLASLWMEAEAACGELWIAGYDAHARYPWGERCTALAGRALLPAPSNHEPDDCCCVCADTYTSLLPTPDPQSMAPPGRFACTGAAYALRHSVCRECDSMLQGLRAHQRRCPFCRADRLLFLRD